VSTCTIELKEGGILWQFIYKETAVTFIKQLFFSRDWKTQIKNCIEKVLTCSEEVVMNFPCHLICTGNQIELPNTLM